MRVDAIYTVRNRGLLIAVVVGDVIPMLGGTVRRVSDGATWQIRGIERHMMRRDLKTGDKVGLLLSDGPEPVEGDEVEIV